jgi:hypothetical protein
MKVAIVWILAVLIFLYPAYSQVFLPSGNKFGKVQGKTPKREPFIIVDTLKLASGKGTIKFNNRFTTELNNVKPTDVSFIFPKVTQLMRDTSDLIHSYGVYVTADSLRIFSDSSDDTSTVAVEIRAR